MKHSDRKDFKCCLCDYKVAIANYLRGKLMQLMNPCRIHVRFVIMMGKLNKHVLAEHEGVKYSCDHCTNTDKVALKQHIKSQH